MLVQNPITKLDFPDPDVIRVGDTYYMVSTTMHFMPGGVILRSYDLAHWEVATYLYDVLEDTPAQRLEDDQCAYGQGMWAASLRHHNGRFYVVFAANDTGKTYLYQSSDIHGPWSRTYIEGFYHDCSLLFDDDQRAYLVYGNTEIKLVELTSDLSMPKPDGLRRVLVRSDENVRLGYEGSHLYKIRGKYYLFLIHWLSDGSGRRVESCLVSDSLEGDFVGKIVLDDDMGYHNQGVAQGGIVDTPDGKWYAILFQDRGAVGRIPVLVPMTWEDEFPVFGVDGRAPLQVEVESTRPGHEYTPLVESDDFLYVPDEDGKVHLKTAWQWNHVPDPRLWTVTDKPGYLRIQSGKLSANVTQAKNTLTQRMTYPHCNADVTVTGRYLMDGDYAGICALQGCYGLIALTREAGLYYLVMLAQVPKDSSVFGRRLDIEPGHELARIALGSDTVRLRVQANFEDQVDEAEFFYQHEEQWVKLGITHKLYFKLDHFVGCRFGLFLFSTREMGGVASFSHFTYEIGEASMPIPN